MYDPSNGNDQLNAETSKGFDLGIVLTPIENTTIDVTYFQNKIRNRITYVTDPVTWNSRYVNRDYTKTKGVEFAVNSVVNNQWSLGLNYTYTEARDYEKLTHKHWIKKHCECLNIWQEFMQTINL